MNWCANKTGQTINKNTLNSIFTEMDANQNNVVDRDEFIKFMFDSFKNFEDNIDFLAKDIKQMDEKITEVNFKIN